MTNLSHPYARYTGLIGATVWLKFRTISGSPSHLHLDIIVKIKYSLISTGLREFWEIATVFKLAAMACCKQYCLSPASAGRVVLRGQANKQEPQNSLQP